MDTEKVAQELLFVAKELLANDLDWEQTRAGYRHTKTGWTVEVFGPKGSWQIRDEHGRRLRKVFRGYEEGWQRAMAYAEEEMRKQRLL